MPDDEYLPHPHPVGTGLPTYPPHVLAAALREVEQAFREAKSDRPARPD